MKRNQCLQVLATFEKPTFGQMENGTYWSAQKKVCSESVGPIPCLFFMSAMLSPVRPSQFEPVNLLTLFSQFDHCVQIYEHVR